MDAVAAVVGLDHAGAPAHDFPLTTRVFALDVHDSDEVLVRARENGLPLVIRRNGEVIVNFDLTATRAYRFEDSKRPFYTYLPGFNVQRVPESIRRPLSVSPTAIRIIAERSAAPGATGHAVSSGWS